MLVSWDSSCENYASSMKKLIFCQKYEKIMIFLNYNAQIAGEYLKTQNTIINKGIKEINTSLTYLCVLISQYVIIINLPIIICFKDFVSLCDSQLVLVLVNYFFIVL